MFTYVALSLRNQPFNTMQETGLCGAPHGIGRVNGPKLIRSLWKSRCVLPGESGALTSLQARCVVGGGGGWPYPTVPSILPFVECKGER